MPIKVKTEREMSCRSIYARGHADTCVFVVEYMASRWSGCRGGHGRWATIWDQVDDVSAIGIAKEPFENLYASGKAERGTRVAQTLSKRKSSHIWRTRSMSKSAGRGREPEIVRDATCTKATHAVPLKYVNIRPQSVFFLKPRVCLVISFWLLC